LRKHPHHNVIEFKGSYVITQEISEFNCSRKGFIQMEKGITSLDHLINERIHTCRYFTEEEVIYFITAMIDAHRHLQSLSIAHRDIKPENIILVGLDPLRYKVCDVGVGTAVGNDSTRTRTLMGTVNYLSPELLKAYRENKFSITYNPYKSDVYSLGLVLVYFCLLVKPLAKDRGEGEEQNMLALIKQIKRAYPGINGLSKTLKQMLQYNDTQRPDFDELYNKIE
jgi:serine/threonine protein kinase